MAHGPYAVTLQYPVPNSGSRPTAGCPSFLTGSSAAGEKKHTHRKKQLNIQNAVSLLQIGVCVCRGGGCFHECLQGHGGRSGTRPKSQSVFVLSLPWTEATLARQQLRQDAARPRPRLQDEHRRQWRVLDLVLRQGLTRYDVTQFRWSNWCQGLICDVAVWRVQLYFKACVMCFLSWRPLLVGFPSRHWAGFYNCRHFVLFSRWAEFQHSFFFVFVFFFP